MTYPPPVHTGDGGEVSGWLRRAAAPMELPHAAFLATGATTGGEFGLYRWEMGVTPAGPEPHFHRSITESFFVLHGTVRLYDGSTWVDASAGDFLHVPKGGVHAFRNESGATASMLLLFTPGAPREEYFEVLADAARREAMDAEQWADFCLRHDTSWV